MGLIEQIFGLVFGSGRNVIRETAEVFRENAEAGAERGQAVQIQAMTQFGAEFSGPRVGLFDRFMDALNRLPRPAMALGTLGLFVAAMVDPVWFAARMQGIALVPEPLWWLLGVIVSFYFGARHQMKTQSFQRDIASSMARVPQVVDNLHALKSLDQDTVVDAYSDTDIPAPDATQTTDGNAALDAWRRRASGPQPATM
jgi:hypothetical protein